MKKLLIILFTAVFFLSALAGCAPEGAQVTPTAEPSPTAPPSDSPAGSPSPETAKPSPAENTAGPFTEIAPGSDPEGQFTPLGEEDGVGMILFSSSEMPLQSQEQTASLELYVYAEQTDGEIAWNDGQNWYLIVRDGEKIYRLMDEVYVQMGQVSYWSYWSYDEEAPHLLVMVTEGAGIRVYSYVYDKQADVFYQSEVFASEGNNGIVDSSIFSAG